MKCFNCHNEIQVTGTYYKCPICRVKYSKYTGEWKKKPFGWEPANGRRETSADTVVDYTIYVFIFLVIALGILSKF